MAAGGVKKQGGKYDKRRDDHYWMVAYLCIVKTIVDYIAID